ncbi:Zinc finger protein 333 [Collichthys lucidus]|uniref:Zinc finger protein 333 n=1 Tax=Collichthys lucidus TaxID=240159 RepID=A0A4U5VCF7_COLLU|nr:Zinc finger protein 333 [Collichthys lucidus]
MSTRLTLKAFVNERLTAAAEEIFQVFERTIAKYEEEASSSKQEIERLRGLCVSGQQTVAPDYRCHLCDKFSSDHHLINHASRLHSKEADVLCAVCGQTLESTESLNTHLKSHKRSKCCHVCGKHFNSTTALAEHMAKHAGVKLHRCHVCGKECSRKGDLKIHMRIHTGEKPFCCSYCLKSFTHSGHLKKHMRSHTGERPHQCEVCGRGFLQSTHLKYHLGTHAQKRKKC